MRFFERDVVVVGGCGHVGLPLGLAFAERGLQVALYDVNQASVDEVASGRMPFDEAGAQAVLDRVLTSRLTASTDPTVVSSAEHVVIVIGTPVDEHLNPDPNAVSSAIREPSPPGGRTADRAAFHALSRHHRAGRDHGGPERQTPRGLLLPRAHRGGEGHDRALRASPDRVGPHRIRAGPLGQALRDPGLPDGTVQPEEAELAKLFTNTWRYIKFATANQLFMMANDFGLDYERIRQGLRLDYPRAADLPGAGFAAGPCLLKDTMQLAAFNNNNFVLGHAAMMVNEGLPLYLVSRLEARHTISDMTVGILGMAFKGESDDVRSSLSYKLRRILRFKAGDVVCHDPYVTSDPTSARWTK